MKNKSLVPCMLLLTACTGTPQPSKEDSFNRIVPNRTTPAELGVLMGKPGSHRQIEISELVDVQIFEYRDAEYLYVVTAGGSRIAGVESKVTAKAKTPRTDKKK